jgi:unsaturated chondroitin disaccharide hydrolase
VLPEKKDVRFLKMAKKIPDFYISHPNMPKELVPFWNFDASDYRDVSPA